MAYIKNKLFTASAIALSATMAGAPVVSTMVQAAGNTTGNTTNPTEVTNANNQVTTTIYDNDAQNNDNDIFTDSTRTGSLTIHKYDFTEAMKELPNLYNGGSKTFKDRQADEHSQLTTDKDATSKNLTNKDAPTWNTQLDQNGWRYESTGEKNNQIEEDLAHYPIPGVTFTYLKVSDVQTYTNNQNGNQNNPGDENVKLIYQIDDRLQEIIGLKTEGADRGANEISYETGTDYYTSQDIINALKTALENNTKTKDLLEKYITDAKTTEVNGQKAEDMPKTNNTGLTTKDNLDLGLYLVVETEVPQKVDDTTNPFFVQIPMTHSDGESWFYDINVYPKNETNTPTVDKYVRNCGSEAGTDSSKEAASYTNSDHIETDKPIGTIANYHEYQYMDSQTASEGDVLDYKVVTKLPEITSSSTYLKDLKFTDQMSKGMSYDRDKKVVIAFYSDKKKAYDKTRNYTNVLAAKDNPTDINATEIWTTDSVGKFKTLNSDGSWSDDANNEGKMFHVQYSPDPKESNKDSSMTITTLDAGLASINQARTKKNDKTGKDDTTGEYTKHSGEYMVVYYQAKVNSDGSTTLGDKGNDNKVRLDWKRTNTVESDTGNNDHIEDKTYIFSYGIDLTKKLSDNGDAFGTDKATKMKDITFDLKNTTDGYYVVAEKTGAGVYNVTGKSKDEQHATQFTPDPATGKFVIRGIEGDTYTLTETHTSHGYMLLKDKIAIKITPRVVDTESTQADLTYHYTKGQSIPDVSKIYPNDGQLPNNSDEVTQGYQRSVMVMAPRKAPAATDDATTKPESNTQHKKKPNDNSQTGKTAPGTDGTYTNDNANGTANSSTTPVDKYESITDETGKKYDVNEQSGTYVLKDGDTAPDSVIIANITEHSSATIDGKKCNMSADGQGDTASQNAIVPLTVLNSRGFTLPHTGGKGLIFLVAAGTVILGLVVSQNRKKEEKVGINKEN